MYYCYTLRFINFITDPDQCKKNIVEFAKNLGTSKLFVLVNDLEEDSLYTTGIIDKLSDLKNFLFDLQADYCVVSDIRNVGFTISPLYDKTIFITRGFITYYNCVVRKNVPITEWKSDSCKGLYLPGKLLRYNRSYLMYRLYKEKITDNLDWSFRTSEKSKKQIKELFFKDISDIEYENFINYCDRELDKDIGHIWGDTGDFQINACIIYDPAIYNNTSFSIVSETWFDYGKVPTLTEKIFKSLLHYHPFVMMGARGTLKALEELGYRTFTEYMLIKDYDDIESEEERLEAVVQNVKFFQSNYHNFIEKIKEDVVHNHNNFLRISKEELSKLENILPKDVDPRTPLNLESFIWW